MNDSIEELIDGVRQDIRKLEKENETLKRGFAEYMGLRELAVYSDLSISVLQGYIHEGILPCFKVKGKVFVKKSEFDSWIEGYRVNQKQNKEKHTDAAAVDEDLILELNFVPDWARRPPQQKGYRSVTG
ncbi:MAG: helix-turn-helix domain-containing protein, partial [Candidatus Hodarchaeota archaeon]